MAKDPNDFSKKTIRILAGKASNVCSKPDCSRNTSGGHSDDKKFTNVGEAAHISGAKGTSARYDKEMTPQQRNHISNGIWLCSTCHTEVDADEVKYSSELLLKWKKEHEETILSKNFKHKYEEIVEIFKTKGYPEETTPITSTNILENALINEAFTEWGKGKTEEAFKLSKDAYFEGNNEVKLQAIVNMVLLSREKPEKQDYFLGIIEEGLQIAKITKALPIEAILMAHKGRLLQIRQITRYLNTYYDLQVFLKTGFPIRPAAQIQEELALINKGFQDILELCFNADKIAIESNDYSAIGHVKMTIATAQGNLFFLHQMLGLDTGTIEALVISELIKAKKIFEGIGDELNRAIVLNNLANNLRFYGDPQRAKKYAEEALAIGEKLNYQDLIIKTKKILECDFNADAENPYQEIADMLKKYS